MKLFKRIFCIVFHCKNGCDNNTEQKNEKTEYEKENEQEMKMKQRNVEEIFDFEFVDKTVSGIIHSFTKLKEKRKEKTKKERRRPSLCRKPPTKKETFS